MLHLFDRVFKIAHKTLRRNNTVFVSIRTFYYRSSFSADSPPEEVRECSGQDNREGLRNGVEMK